MVDRRQRGEREREKERRREQEREGKREKEAETDRCPLQGHTSHLQKFPQCPIAPPAEDRAFHT
jgi:hypothetical protein